MVLLNARSIRNKMDEFHCLIATENFDIVGVTESWIHCDGPDFEGEFDLPGYAMFHKDRIGRQGGGILLYVRSHLTATRLPIDSPYELMGVELNGQDAKVQLFLLYRPPHQTLDSDTALYSLLSRLTSNGVSIIAGDFNCRVRWQDGTADVEGTRLLEFANDNFLTQVVDKPTRGVNILDLIFTTDEDLVTQVSVRECLGTSDHNMVTCELAINTSVEMAEGRRMLNFRRANFDKFRRELDLLQPPELDTVERMWSDFKAKYLAIQADCIPTKKAGGNSTKRNPKWFNLDIKNAIAERVRLYDMDVADPNDLNHRALVAQRRLVKRTVRDSKRDNERRVALASKDNPKEFFQHVNSRKPARACIGSIKTDLGELLSSNADVADELNRFFTSVFTIENVVNMPEPAIVYDGIHPLVNIECTPIEIQSKINKLNANKSAGPDGFLPRVIKEVKDQIVPHLLAIFNRSLDHGLSPEDMKIANVTPIHKKGPKDIAGNYRPISLTSVVGKMLESIIADKIVEHLERNDLLGDSQHGFRRGRSCLTNLLEFFHHMITVFDSSKAIDVLYLDFKKAFDKVPHARLMTKVRALGIGGSVAKWIESWLANRKQRVVINGTHSRWSNVTSGVPQGSVLGPLLFLIYINDLDTDLISKVSKFADDTKLGVNAAKPEAIQGMQQDLDKIGEWSEKWQMPFNTDKCKVMHIGFANPKVNYSLLGSQLQDTVLEKDLGVLISSDLKFSAQCIAVEKQAQKLLGYIRRQFQFRDKEIVLALYNALVRPLLEYAVQFWSPTLVKDIERLERVQKRATKLIPSIRNKGYERRLNDLKLFTLEKRRLRGQLIETFKILKGLSNIDYGSLFTLNENNTRNHGWKISLKRFNTRPCGDFMTYRICNVWNRLPDNVVNSGSVDTFKRRLDRILPDLNY
jgi:hypothetical protein